MDSDTNDTVNSPDETPPGPTPPTIEVVSEPVAEPVVAPIAESASDSLSQPAGDSPWAPRREVATPPVYDYSTSAYATTPETFAYQQPQPKGFSGKHVVLVIIVSLITALLGASCATIAIFRMNPRTNSFAQMSPAAPRDTLGVDTGTDLSINVAAKVLPSVVSVAVLQEHMTMMGAMQAEGNGSGVIIRDDGYILTNYHVIENVTRIEITVGTEAFEATVVGIDPSSDLAVLKIETEGLPVIDIGTSSDLRVGQYVMAVGNPFGLSESVSVGIISALGRTEAVRSGGSLAAYANLIQTDAAINPGNSGGALVDADGRLIGINTLIRTTSGSSAGVGFAIPVDTALDIASQLIEGGEAFHSFLGVTTQTVDRISAQQFRLPVEEGAYIVEVLANTPADEAGLKKGDIIIRIGDRAISTSEDVFAAVRSHRDGDTVEIEYYRDDKLQTTKATLTSDKDMLPPAQESRLEVTPENAMRPNPHEGIIPDELVEMFREYGFSHNW